MAKRFTEECNKKINKSKKKNRKVWLIIFIILLILMISVLLFGIIKLIINKGNMQKTVSDVITSVTGEKVETIYALILGVSEDIDVELTDTIILAAYNPDTQKAFMISVPRDTYIGTSTKKVSMYDKINAIYSKYGVEKTIEYVEEITGVEIDYHAVIRTSALIEIVDIIGGVEFEVPINMKYDDKSQNLHINLKKGLQVLDGKKAEQLLRFRHNNDGSTYSYEYGDNDYGRMRTQREFIKATIEQTIQLQNILKTKEIITAIFDNLETDITLSKLLAYVPYMMSFDINELKMEQLPGISVKKNEVWVYEHNKIKTEKMIKELINDLNNVIEESNTTGDKSNTASVN